MNQVYRAKHHPSPRSVAETEAAAKLARLEAQIEKLQNTINQQAGRYARAFQLIQEIKRKS